MPCGGNCREFLSVTIATSPDETDFSSWHWIERSSESDKGKKVAADPASKAQIDASHDTVQDKLKAKALQVARSKECAAGCGCEHNKEAKEEKLERPYAPFRVKYNDRYDVAGRASLTLTYKQGTCQDDLTAKDP